MKYTWTLYAAMLLIAAACATEDVTQESVSSRRPDSPQRYKVVVWEDVSHALARRAAARVMMDVHELPSLDDIKRVAREVREQQRGRWDDTTVFVYLPDMDVHGPAYGIARFPAQGAASFEIHNLALAFTRWHAQTPTAKANEARQKKLDEQHQRRVADGQVLRSPLFEALSVT